MIIARTVVLLALVTTGVSEVRYQVSLFSRCDVVYQIEHAEKVEISYLVYQQPGGCYTVEGQAPYTVYAWFKYHFLVEEFVGMAGRAGDTIAEFDHEFPDHEHPEVDHYKKLRGFVGYVRSRGVGVESLDTAVPIDRHVPEFKLTSESIVGIKIEEFGPEFLHMPPTPDPVVVTVAHDDDLDQIRVQIEDRVSVTRAWLRNANSTSEETSKNRVPGTD